MKFGKTGIPTIPLQLQTGQEETDLAYGYCFAILI